MFEKAIGHLKENLDGANIQTDKEYEDILADIVETFTPEVEKGRYIRIKVKDKETNKIANDIVLMGVQ